MILALRSTKRPKHGGSIFGRKKLRRKRIEGHNKLVRATSRSPPLSLCANFGAFLGWESNCLSTMQSVMKYDRFFE
jgi:hypothetical protein